MTDVTFLYSKDSPNWKKALKSLNMILSEEGVNTRVRKVQVRSEEEAEKWKFPGSPTIRIDGQDIDPSFHDTGTYGLSVRKYPGGQDEAGMPPEDMIRRAVRRAFPL